MTAEELLQSGHLSAAVEQLNQEVRSRPTDTQRRTFLFESATSGKAGGLKKVEPLKAVRCCEPLKAVRL